MGRNWTESVPCLRSSARTAPVPPAGPRATPLELLSPCTRVRHTTGEKMPECSPQPRPAGSFTPWERALSCVHSVSQGAPVRGVSPQGQPACPLWTSFPPGFTSLPSTSPTCNCVPDQLLTLASVDKVSFWGNPAKMFWGIRLGG